MRASYPVLRVLSPFGETVPAEAGKASTVTVVARSIEFMGGMSYDNTSLYLGSVSGHLFQIKGNPGWPDLSPLSAGSPVLQAHMRRVHSVGDGQDIWRTGDPSVFLWLEHIVAWEDAGVVDTKYESGPATTLLFRSGNRVSIAGTAEDWRKLYEGAY